MASLIKFFIIGLFALSIGFLNLAANADPGNSGQGKGLGVSSGKKLGANPRKNLSTKPTKIKTTKGVKHFSKTDKATIANFFNQNPFPATALPPGIAMNLARGKPLPPGIAKKLLPSDLLTRLPSYPGYEYRIVGNDVVLVDTTTNIVTDVLTNILK